MRVIEHPVTLRIFLAPTLALLLAGDAWRFTIGWAAFGVLSFASVIYAVILLIARRDRGVFARLPIPLVVFLALATLSVAWSFYPAATALGLMTTWMITIAAFAIATCFSWREILTELSRVLRWVLALSIVFELFVSLVLRRPILPLHTQPGVDYSIYDRLPDMLYWSRNELFEVLGDGRIQGIVGNANHLGFLALLTLIVVGIQWADASMRRTQALSWMALAALTMALTRSATATVALVGVAVIAATLMAIRRAGTPRRRAGVYAAFLGVIGLGAAAVAVFQSRIFELLGKSSDLTGRLEIWESVTNLAAQRPVFGWGWVSYWVPWAPPFDDLAFRNGVRQLQAHNAWLDVWLQLGIVGVVVLAALVISMVVRAWLAATDPPQNRPDQPGRYSALTLAPVLILVALLVQSVAESRLLVEFGWAFVVIIAVSSLPGAVRPRVEAP